jgi:hypothetical protein
MDVIRPISRPTTQRPAAGPRPTLVRTPGDSSLFRGWGVTL